MMFSPQSSSAPTWYKAEVPTAHTQCRQTHRALLNGLLPSRKSLCTTFSPMSPAQGQDARAGCVLARSHPTLSGCSPGEHRPRYSAHVLLAAWHTAFHGSGLHSLSAFVLLSSKLSRVSGSGSQNGLQSLRKSPLVYGETLGIAQRIEIPLLSQPQPPACDTGDGHRPSSMHGPEGSASPCDIPSAAQPCPGEGSMA